MNEPKSLDSIFKGKVFRIPDYQRGYAWQEERELNHFWEDLINLSGDRSHYTGLLTLKEFESKEISDNDNEYWLIEDHSYKMYYIVDGQQRLTTFVIFIQAFIEVVKQFPENDGKENKEIYITDTLTLEDVISKYLFKTKPTGDQYRTYKFGYAGDNPSYEYLRHKIFNEPGGGLLKKTLYTRNLEDAKGYFYEKLKSLCADKSPLSDLQEIYKKLTKKFLFNEYVIKDEFDVYVAFETMNNRGKSLSKLELLKNRLIYLTALYTDDEIGNSAGRSSLRNDINSAWKEVYHQLGRCDKYPLEDDHFLQAHGIMYYFEDNKDDKEKRDDYINFLLNDKFSPKKVKSKSTGGTTPSLPPLEIREYVNSLKDSAVHWFNSWHPFRTDELTDAQKYTLNSLNVRMGGIKYFRPLIMSFLKNEKSPEKRTKFLKQVERFGFIVFLLCQESRHFEEIKFSKASREFDRGELDLEGIIKSLNESAAFCFHPDKKTIKYESFYNYLRKKFENKKGGFYDWDGLKHFLYEYEESLIPRDRGRIISWENQKEEKLSIEHIFPQTTTGDWKNSFSNVHEDKCYYYLHSLGNLLLLPNSIKQSLINRPFKEKIKKAYSNGTYAEFEVSKYPDWTPSTIEERGLHLLSFMEKRWDIKFKDKDKKKLLFLHTEDKEKQAI